MHIKGGHLKAIDYKMPVASAQVKTSVVASGIFAEGETRVEEPLRTRDHGELALRAFGAEVEQNGNEVRIAGGQKLHAIEANDPRRYFQRGIFPVCCGLCFLGSQLVIHDLLMNPTRARLLEILISLGVGISVTQMEEQHHELRGTVAGRKAESSRACRFRVRIRLR